MKLPELISKLDLRVISGADMLDREVTGGYTSDILSDVLTHAGEGNVWVTRQIHLNIIPIASARDLAAIIVVNSRKPETEVLEKSAELGMPVLGTGLNAFAIVGRMYGLGLRGDEEEL